jgi:hypothetical protein
VKGNGGMTAGLADEISAIQVEVLCCCGLPGKHKARPRERGEQLTLD